MEEHQATLDVDAAVASIGADLFNGGEPMEDRGTPQLDDDLELPVEKEPSETTHVDEVTDTPDKAVEAPIVEAKPVPKTWPKEMAEHWAKTPKEVQDYWDTREKQMLDGLEQYKEYSHVGKTLTDVMKPYTPMLRASGVDEVTAVQTLLNANYRLTTGPIESKRAAFMELGASLGLIPPQNMPQEPPQLRQMRERQEMLERTLLQNQEREFQQQKQVVTSQVESFAKDKPFFDEVADDIVAFINKGDTLETAYDKAVYANPVTRAKEIARLNKEAQDKLVAKGKQEAAQARQATAANVKSRDTGRSSTEIMGTMEDTMKEVLLKRKAREAH